MSEPAARESRRHLLETVGSRGAALGLSFVAQILAARILGPVGNGQFGAAVTLANGLGVIATWTLGPVLLNRAGELGPVGRKKLRETVFALRLALGLGAGLAGAGLWANFTHGWSESLALVFLVASSAHDNLWQFQACGKTSAAYHLMALQGLFNALGFALLPWVPGSPVWCAVLIQAVACLLARLAGHAWLRGSYDRTDTPERAPPGPLSLLASARWNVVAGLVAFGAGFSDTLICRVLVGVEDTGYLRCAQMLLVAPLALVQASASLAQAKWARLRQEQGNTAAATAALAQTRRIALFLLLACPFLSAAAWFGLRWVMGANYAPVGPLIAAWIFVLPLAGASLLLQSFLQVAERFQGLLRLNLLICAISLSLNLLLMPVWGLWVAVLASVAANATAVWFSSREVGKLAGP